MIRLTHCLFLAGLCCNISVAATNPPPSSQDTNVDAAFVPTPDEADRNERIEEFSNRNPFLKEIHRKHPPITCDPNNSPQEQGERTVLRHALQQRDIPKITKYFNSNDMFIRCAAARGLTILGGDTAAQALLTHLGAQGADGSANYGLPDSLIIEGLKKIATPELLGNALKSASWQQQRVLSDMLGNMGVTADSQAPALGELCNHDGNGAWQQAYDALKKINGPKAHKAREHCIETFAQSLARSIEKITEECSAGEPKLREKLAMDQLDNIEWTTDDDGEIHAKGLTSSVLVPKTKKPEVELPAKQNDIDAWFAALRSYQASIGQENGLASRMAQWGCQYSALNAWDGDPKTAWVPADGHDGIGEILIAPRKGATLEIWAGYGKSKALFKDNSRPRDIRVYLIEGNDEAVDPGVYYNDLHVMDVSTVTLKDIDGFQPLPLPNRPVPPAPTSNDHRAQFVAIEILSVYPGAKYHDTAISEIRSLP